MLKRILKIINHFVIANSLIRVNNLFFVFNKKSNLIRLENNFVFRHACMTPLTILACSLDNLEISTSKHEKKENIKIAKDSIKRLNKLISNVTRSNDDNQQFDVHAAVNEVIYLFKSKSDCKIFYSNFLPNGLKLLGSRLYFQEIIICLLNNAYEAYKDKELAHISLSVRIIKGQIFIGVVDFAKGMTSLGQKLALIRGISYKKNGCGLGLSFVKQTIENEFKGVFKIISGYGVGTHVQVAIPIPEPCSQNLLQS